MAACVDLEARWGHQRLPFRLRRAEVKRLRIVVNPDGCIAVTAPLRATDEEVRARVSRRGDWIVRQRRRFALWHPRTPPRQYLSGETHLFLGRQLRLQVMRSAEPGVSMADHRLRVRAGNPADRSEVRTQVEAWYRDQARRLLHRRFDEQAGFWRRHGIDLPRLVVRTLSNRWGSLTNAGTLVLNAELVRAAPGLIDYVIAHEMAHIRFPNHGSEWRRMLGRIMPDWEQRKVQLERQLL